MIPDLEALMASCQSPSDHAAEEPGFDEQIQALSDPILEAKDYASANANVFLFRQPLGSPKNPIDLDRAHGDA